MDRKKGQDRFPCPPASASWRHALLPLGRARTDEQLAADTHRRSRNATSPPALELLDVRQRARLYRLLGAERLGDVFAYVSDAGKYLRELPQEQAADIVEAMDADDAVDALETVSPNCAAPLMEKLDPESQHDIRLICSYQPDEIAAR